MTLTHGLGLLDTNTDYTRVLLYQYFLDKKIDFNNVSSFSHELFAREEGVESWWHSVL